MGEKLLEVKNLSKYFKTKNGMLHAVDNMSFYINKGETLGLVGESGCGKSTAGRAILRLHEPTKGEVIYNNENIVDYSNRKMKDMRKELQMVFQDPFSSLNPRFAVERLIAEPIIVNKIYKTSKEVRKKVAETMNIVGLEKRLINAYPHELDGGRRQRIGIARAISIDPKFIVLDEPVSALDVCIQAQILNLMIDLQEEYDLTFLFISHDLSVVKHISSRIAVMYLGQIIELAESDILFKKPLHPYTQALISAIPIAKMDLDREKIILKGDVPSPVNLPEGCRFYGRCRLREDICKETNPKLRAIGGGRYVACHLVKD